MAYREKPEELLLGVIKELPEGWFFIPADRRKRERYALPKPPRCASGTVAQIKIQPDAVTGQNIVRIAHTFDRFDSASTVAALAVVELDLPNEFSFDAENLARQATPVTPHGRVDFRELPLVTIDGEDARDYDDAVFAEAQADGGFRLLVAIADVAHYVKPNDALDIAALERGNSVYLPDRVIPMLPEALSNNLCSLMPNVDRACMVAEIWLDDNGQIRGHTFHRGIMRSVARLTYTQVEAALNGQPDSKTAPLMQSVILPLQQAYHSLLKARRARGTLDLSIAEFKIAFNENKEPVGVNKRYQLSSNQLIEEFMIAANVAAAETLQNRKMPGVYRVHAPPTPEKYETLQQTFPSPKRRWPKLKDLKAKDFSGLIAASKGEANETLLQEMILRTQSQALYSPVNSGHFGLGLEHYAHFTSPIRRYADLLVHRALIRSLGLGNDGLDDRTARKLNAICTSLGECERRAMQAERTAVDRFRAQLLSKRVGESFVGLISGISPSGLFFRDTQTGADGLIKLTSLGDDFFRYDQKHQRYVGARSKAVFALGQPIEVRLEEANPISGGLLFTPTSVLSAPLASRRSDDRRGDRGRSYGRQRDERGSARTSFKKKPYPTRRHQEEDYGDRPAATDFNRQQGGDKPKQGFKKFQKPAGRGGKGRVDGGRKSGKNKGFRG